MTEEEAEAVGDDVEGATRGRMEARVRMRDGADSDPRCAAATTCAGAKASAASPWTSGRSCRSQISSAGVGGRQATVVRPRCVPCLWYCSRRSWMGGRWYRGGSDTSWGWREAG